MIKWSLGFLGGRELAKAGAPFFFMALVVAIFLNVALLPAESGADVSSDFAQILRAAALVLIGLVGGVFLIDNFVVPRLASGVLLSYISFFLVPNLLAGAITVNWIAFVLSILVSAFLINSAVSSSLRFRQVLVGSIECVLIFWVFAFFFQQISYYSSGEIVELHNLFTPYSVQRTELLSSGLARLGGAHIEPGTHANWVYGLVLLRAIYLRRLFDRLSVFSLLSIPLTMSFWGLISSFVLFLAYIIKPGKFKASRIFISTVFVFAFFAVLYYAGQLDSVLEYMQTRSQVQDESTEAKMAGVVGFFANFHEYILFGAPHTYDFCSGCLSPQDIGVFLNTVVKVGFFFSLFFFFSIYKSFFKIFGVSGFLFALPLVFAKWFYWEPILWLVVFAAVAQADISAKVVLKIRASK
jgi:hypothetical protein